MPTSEICEGNLNGKWVVLLDEHIIASGDNIKEILEEARKMHPNKRLILARVPEEGTMIY